MAKEEVQEAKKSYTYVPFWPAPNRCYEAVLVDGREAFLTFHSGKFQVVDELELGDDRGLKPVEYTQAKYSFAQEEIESAVPPDLPHLYEEVYAFYRDYFAHFDPRVQKFLALYLIHGYVLTKSAGTIFVWLVGQKRTGKTTAQLIAEALGYRAFSGVAPSEAALYRTLGYEVEYGPLIICREYEHASDVLKEIVREGDIPGASVPRADKVDDRFVVNHYHLYGSRFNGSNTLHGSEADMDRYCLIKCVHLQPSRPRVELYRSEAVVKKIKEVRNSLLLWKLASWASLKFPLEDPAGEIVEGRDWEHYGGVITLAAAVSSELEREIRDFVNERLAEGREEEKFQLRSQLVEIIKALADEEHFSDDGYRIGFTEIWEALKAECTPYIENGVEVRTKLIGGDGEVVTTHKVGKIIREQLFGERRVWKDSERSSVKGYLWTAEKLSLALGRPLSVKNAPPAAENQEVAKIATDVAQTATSDACLPSTVSTVFGPKKRPMETQIPEQNDPQNTSPGGQKNGNNGRQASNGRQTVTNPPPIVFDYGGNGTPAEIAQFRPIGHPTTGMCGYCGEVKELAGFLEGDAVCFACKNEEQAAAPPKEPAQPNTETAQNAPDKPRSHLVHQKCSVCGKELGTAGELSVFTIDKQHYCRQHFEAKKAKEGAT